MRQLRQFEEIAQTKDLRKAIRLARGLDADWSVIHVEEHGYIWIAKGETVVWSETDPPAKNSYKALLSLLAVDPGVSYTVGESFAEPPGRMYWMDITLNEIQNDIVGVAELLKELADSSDETQDVSAVSAQWKSDNGMGEPRSENDSAFEIIKSRHLEAEAAAKAEVASKAEVGATSKAESDVVPGVADNVDNVAAVERAEEAAEARQEFEFFSTAALEAKEFHEAKAPELDVEADEEKIQADLKALGSVLSEPGERFFEQTPVSVDQEDEEALAKKRSEFELIKDFVAEPDERFHDKSELAEGPDGMTEFQLKVLDIVQDMQDPIEFAEKNEELRDEVILHSTLEAPAPHIETEPEVDEDNEPAALDATALTDAAILSNAEHSVDQRGFDRSGHRQVDDKTLLTREGVVREVAVVNIPVKQPGLTQKQMAIFGAFAAVALVFVFVAIHSADDRAKAAAQDRRTVAAMVDATADDQGLKGKPKEARFRLPDAGSGTGRGGYGGGSGTNKADDGDSVSDDVGQFEFEPPANPAPPPSGQEVAEADAALRRGDSLAAGSRYSEAIQVYGSALERCPSHLALRVALVRSYAAAGQIKQARAICIAGMRLCSREGDFNMLYELLRTLR